MKKFYFEKIIREDGNISILATANGWTNEYTEDGEVDTSLEYTINNEISQEEAEVILKEYGWAICQECGNIFADGGECCSYLIINGEFKKDDYGRTWFLWGGDPIPFPITGCFLKSYEYTHGGETYVKVCNHLLELKEIPSVTYRFQVSAQ